MDPKEFKTYSQLKFPLTDPKPIGRREIFQDDAEQKVQLRDDNEGKGYEFVRKIRDALMGSVWQAIPIVRRDDWIPVPNGRVVAIKQLEKWCIQQGKTIGGHSIRENPLQEVAIMQYFLMMQNANNLAERRMKKAAMEAGTPEAYRDFYRNIGLRTEFEADGGCENVLKLLDFYQDESRIYIILEFMEGGELFDLVSSGRINESMARVLFYQMVKGSHYMHTVGIAHRDISLENAMIIEPITSEKLTTKIIDFGLSIQLPWFKHTYHASYELLTKREVNDNVKKLWSEAIGLHHDHHSWVTPAFDGRIGKERYMPPEVYTAQQYDGVSVDTWELGVSLFVLLFTVYPYQVACPKRCKYFSAISQGKLKSLLHDWKFDEKVSPEVIDLLVALLHPNPASRPNLQDVLRHPWFYMSK